MGTLRSLSIIVTMAASIYATAACGGSSPSSSSSNLVDKTATAVAEGYKTIEAEGRSTAEARITTASGALATVAAAPSATAAPPLTLPSDTDGAFAQAGAIFIALTQKTKGLVANYQDTDAWKADLRQNMQGYRALAAAWSRFTPAACSAPYQAGLQHGYGSYATGAEGVLQRLDAGQVILAAPGADFAPLLESGRTKGVDFGHVMVVTLGPSSNKPQDPQDVVRLAQSLGVWGASNEDLAALISAYYPGGGLQSPRPSC